ncbi:MAG: hypothetical protein WC748_07380 [Legionellales bacterium]|jgi:hypothetical protein
MMRLLLNTLPTWGVILGMTLFSVFIGWLLYSLLRHFLPKFLINQEPHDARESMHLTSVLSALLLTFMVVLLWQSYDILQQNVVNEAKTIGRLEIFTESLPVDHDKKISGLLESYVNVLVNEEWPAMRLGQSSPKASEILLELRYAIEAIDAKTPALSNYRHDMLQDYNDIVFARNLRLDHLGTTIPVFFLVTITVNLLGMFLLLCLLNPASHKRSHFFFLITTSAILGLNFSFLIVLDYPFSGELSINSAPLTYIHFD